MRVPLFVSIACVVPLFSLPASAQIIPPTAIAREALGHYLEGEEHLSAERWERARRSFVAAIELHPLLTDAHYGLGRAFMGLERFTSAALAFQRCLEATRNVHGLRESARVEADRLMLEAVDEMRDTIRRRGSDTLRGRQLDAYVSRMLGKRKSLSAVYEPPARVLLALGSAHYRAGNVDRAQYYWSEAVRIEDGLGEAWNNLAVVQLRAGRQQEAAEAVKNAERAGFRVNPQLKDAIATLKH